MFVDDNRNLCNFNGNNITICNNNLFAYTNNKLGGDGKWQ